MDEWNNNWKTELRTKHENQQCRLCDCVNKKNDIALIAKLMYKYNHNKTKNEVLCRNIEWICYWNEQINICPTDL